MQCLTSPSAFLLVVPTVTCSGGHSFCFGCGQDKGHAPVICKVAEAWVSSRDSGTTEWLNVRRILTAYFLSAYTRYRLTHANAPNALIISSSPVVASKNIPLFFSPSIPTYLSYSRMVCRHCKFQFCWVCLRDWDVHGYNQNVCNSYVEPKPSAEMDQAKANLRRWMFYYDRFNNHEVSAKLDREIAERVEDKMEKMQNKSSLSWIEVRFKSKTDPSSSCPVI